MATTVYFLVVMAVAAAAAAAVAALPLLELETVEQLTSTLLQLRNLPRPAAITEEPTTDMSAGRVIEVRTTPARYRHRSIIEIITITAAALRLAAFDTGLMVGVNSRPTRAMVADTITRRAAAVGTKTFVLDRKMA